MSDKKLSFEEIGEDLVNSSKDQELDALPLTTRLFPYIYVASRRMSLRGISRWLEEKHGVNLSYASISRAMNRPKHHLKQFAEYVEPIALYVAGLYGHEPMKLLYDEYVEGLSLLEYYVRVDESKDPHSDMMQSEAFELANIWLPIPDEVKKMLMPYLNDAFSRGGEDEDDYEDFSDELENEY